MKIKNLKLFLASALVFALIGTFRSCRDYKVKHESKAGEITQKIEKIGFDDIFTPAEEPVELDVKPEIYPSKSK